MVKCHSSIKRIKNAKEGANQTNAKIDVNLLTIPVKKDYMILTEVDL